MVTRTYCLTKLWSAVLLVLVWALGCAQAEAQNRSERDLVAALRGMYSEDVGEARYFLSWFDLNGDGTPEAIAHVVGPRVCGTGGCDTHIFARRGRGYRLISTIGLSRPLIVASRRRTQGWRNLIVYIAGGGILPGYYVELRFNGRAYPENPTVGPAKRVGGEPKGKVLIEKYEAFTQGRPLIPPPRQSNNGMHPTANSVAFMRETML
jgi:hypothetical protein